MSEKPQKPAPDFPLYPHGSGKWACKHQGRTLYFGRWDDPMAALRDYESYLKSTDSVTVAPGLLSVADAANSFLSAKKNAMLRKEIGQRTFTEYLRTAKKFCEVVGRDRAVTSLGPADFVLYRDTVAKTWNVQGVSNEVGRVRTLFKWLHESQLIATPAAFGPDFKKAPERVLRRHRSSQGEKMLEPPQILLLIDEAGTHLKAMLHLAVNCGFGPGDCGQLPLKAVDLSSGWINYPRPKTAVGRRCPLWPETVAAMRASLARRYTPRQECEHLFFVRPDGSTWGSESSKPICKHFRQARDRAGLPRCGAYWLRHVFRTVGGGEKDQEAMSVLMGHAERSMADVYRERIDDERLIAITSRVRRWLFGQ